MMDIIITSISLIPAYYGAVKKPILSLAMLILFLPTFLIRWHLGPIAFNTLDMLVTGIFIFWLASHFKQAKYILKQRQGILLLPCLWFLAATITLFYTDNLLTALGIWKSYFIIPLLTLVLFLAIVRSKKDLKTIILALALLILIIAGTALIQLISPSGINSWLAIPNESWRPPNPLRVTSFLEYPNALGLLLAPLVPLVLGLFIINNKTCYKIISLAAVGGAIFTIYLARSKGALLALGLAILFWLVMYYKKRALMVLMLIGSLILLFLPSFNFLVTAITPISYSAQLRFIQWREAWEFLMAKPITGAGIAGYQTAIAPYHFYQFLEIFLYPHNIILNFWVELGIFGLMLFLVLIGYGLTKNIALIKKFGVKSDPGNLALLGIVSLLIIIIHGLVDVPYFKNDLAIIFWLVWSWPILIKQVFTENQ